MKLIKIEMDKKGRIELFKLNRKGFYNFIRYITREEIPLLKKEFKEYEIKNKLEGETEICG